MTGSPLPRSSSSLVEELLELQRAANRAWLEATPAERSAAAREALRRMPGQAYLFADDEAARDRRALEQLDGHVGRREQAIISQTLRPPGPADQQGAG